MKVKFKVLGVERFSELVPVQYVDEFRNHNFDSYEQFREALNYARMADACFNDGYYATAYEIKMRNILKKR